MFPNPTRVAGVLAAAGMAGWLLTAAPPDPDDADRSARLAVAQLHDDGSAAEALAAERDARHRGLSLAPPLTLYLLAFAVAAAVAVNRSARRLQTTNIRSRHESDN